MVEQTLESIYRGIPAGYAEKRKRLLTAGSSEADIERRIRPGNFSLLTALDTGIWLAYDQAGLDADSESEVCPGLPEGYLDGSFRVAYLEVPGTGPVGTPTHVGFMAASPGGEFAFAGTATLRTPRDSTYNFWARSPGSPDGFPVRMGHMAMHKLCLYMDEQRNRHGFVPVKKELVLPGTGNSIPAN